ncbi:MAG: phage portal protein [Oscillospiraceae bacterium]|nr:phage portal protein [Oscillospiraceae bacterium]
MNEAEKIQTAARAGAMQAKGYSEAGASRTRRALRGFGADSGSPREDIDWNNMTLRQRGRMLYMSSPVATSAVNTNRTKIVGTGLTLKATVDRALLGLTPEAALEWQDQTEREFRLWAERKQNCDATGMNSFAEMQQLAVASWLMSGDVFAVVQQGDITPTNPYALRLHLVEADRVRTPAELGGTPGGFALTEGTARNGNRIYDGVEVDAAGRAVAYYIHNTYPRQATIEQTKWERVEAYGAETGLPNILHMMNSERCDQYRGVSYLAPVIEPLLQLRRFTDSELMAALIQSFFTAWIVTETDPSRIPMNEVGGGDVFGVPALNPQSENISGSGREYEMGPGTVLHLKDGEKVEFGNPNIPTTGFDTFVKTLCRLIGAGLGVPYDVLIKEYNSSYSASRAALQDAWDDFKMRRSWLVSNLCQPIYEIWLCEAVARGRVKAPGFWSDPLRRAAWSGAQWSGPVQASLDPKKEAEAAVLYMQTGLKTHEQAARELGGGDWWANVEQLAQENAALTAAGGVTDPSVCRDDGEDGGD